MIRILVVCIVLAGAAAGSQVFHMDLPTVVSIADTVLLAEILSVEELPGLYGMEVRFGLRPLTYDIVVGTPDTVLYASYFMEYPRSYHLEDGSEIWESPLVSGSGLEMTCGTGDTVTAFLAGLTLRTGLSPELLRIEPAGSFEDIRRLAGDRDF